MSFIKKFILSILNSFGLLNAQNNFADLKETSIYDFNMKTLAEKDKSLADYKGKVVIIVNVASKCGLTPQYKSLEATFEKYQEKGLVILGFPANDFLLQEPGTNSEIGEFCQKNYGVTFDMFSKITVKGPEMHPLYQFLTQKKYNGIEDADVKWNFQKFIIDRNGKMQKIVAPRSEINAPENIEVIEKLLAQ
ncbi:MAG: glutathione peroxidase [Chitinophagales bacterium]